MDFNTQFKRMPGGEDFITIPDEVLDRMRTDQNLCYKIVQAVKTVNLPPSLQERKGGPLCHARWLTTGQKILFMWTRSHGLTGCELKVLAMLVKFCLKSYFKI